MRFINAKFIKSASKKAEFIEDELPQIAIVGRSNVGKSSLINMLTNNGKLAKTSSMPGRTRLVNYFNINNQFYLVDLPGYGFAKASKNLTSAWDSVMNDYFVENEKLKLVLVLLDSRLMPTELDKQMLDYLATHEIASAIILTKTDKISRSELNNNIAKISKEIRFNLDLIIPTSASKKDGVEKVGALLDEYIK
ncbi:MAG: YihA family ribosome biogenesis GTP-binding protein [Clostridiales bacterium]|nr:YihA family ribosome biogenesis GTP-binding protein [Clostridiales bacterium]